MNILQSDSGWASEEDKLGRFRRDCMAALYDLYTSDSLQAALTALYAKLLVIMGQQLPVFSIFCFYSLELVI